MKYKVVDDIWDVKIDVHVDLFLVENNWDDFGYRTTYQVYQPGMKDGQNDPIHLGGIRIMKIGQKVGESGLIKALLKTTVFESLPEGFVSLSFDIDLFTNLRSLFSTDQRKQLQKDLSIILSKKDPLFEAVKDDVCFNKSLLRDSSIDSYYLQESRHLMLDEETLYNLRKQNVVLSLPKSDDKYEFSFSSVDFDDSIAPNGMSVFIGLNGAGKSTLIHRLAKLIWTTPDNRYLLKDVVGSIEPNDIGVRKLFVISYSPFDNFMPPGFCKADLEKIRDGLPSGSGRLIYCGIRDMYSELSEFIRDNKFNDNKNLFSYDRRANTKLKSQHKLAIEFLADLFAVFQNHEKGDLWRSVMKETKSISPNLPSIIDEFLTHDNDKNTILFLNLSTGTKYILHSLTKVIAYIEPNSLVLFDEPENHIYPPLLSFLMSAFRKILFEYNSVMFVATHSPVILQETFSKNVFIVKSENDAISLRSPTIETFGANSSTIITEVFNLTTDKVQFYNVMDQMWNEWNLFECDSVDSLLSEVERKIGNAPSGQMVSYIVGKYYQKHK